MRDSTARIVRLSLLGQRAARFRILEGYASRRENLKKDIKKWRSQIAEAEDLIRSCDEGVKEEQERIAEIVDAYHDLWDEDLPTDDELKR